jgi:hypothetical protein
MGVPETIIGGVRFRDGDHGIAGPINVAFGLRER